MVTARTGGRWHSSKFRCTAFTVANIGSTGSSASRRKWVWCSQHRLAGTPRLRPSTFCAMVNLSNPPPTRSALHFQQQFRHSSACTSDGSQFKKSSDLRFCRHQRCYQADGDGSYTVLKPSIQISTWRDMPAVTATLVSNEGNRNVLSLAVVAIANGPFRIAISDLEDSLHERYIVNDVVMNHCKALSIEGTMLSVKEELATIFIPDRENGMSIHFNPFRLDVVARDSGKVAATINSESRLLVEDYGRTPWVQHGESLEEKLEDDSDPQLRGPESVGVDVSFPATEHLCGIPERASSFSFPDTKSSSGEVLSEPYRMYNLDVNHFELDQPMGLYGSVPFLYARTDSSVTGLFWHNTSETYLDVQTRHTDPRTKATHWFSESGIVDIFLLSGDSANDVFKQYLFLTGSPPLPPLFSLGYHQCRYSYEDEVDVREVDARFNSHSIPYDVMWLDIDHTDGKRYFTWDYEKYSDPVKLQEDLAKNGRKTVAIIDPHIKCDDSYSLHTHATKEGLYVQRPDGSNYVGKCWAGKSSYLNFLSPRVREEWGKWFNKALYPEMTEHLHVWNDMNEPSVFGEPEGTMPKDLLHAGVEHRHVHNLYGHSMARATYEGLLKNRPDERPFVLTRSFFAGTQRFAAVWTGDNTASWAHLRSTVRMLTSLQICGLALSGADVGGFFGDPSGELAVRWYQVGAFQPFFRGHSNKGTKRREPWVFGEEFTACIRHAIRARYEFLTYWYTLFASLVEDIGIENRGPPMRPVWWEFDGWEDDESMWMVGDSLLVAPIVEQGVRRHVVDIPEGRWYELYDGEREIRNTVDTEAGLDRMVVLLRGGKVIPRMVADVRSSSDVSHGKYSLLVGLDERNAGEGVGYFDDGTSQRFKSGDFCVMRWSFGDDELQVERVDGEFIGGGVVEMVTVRGFGTRAPKRVTVHDEVGVSEVTFRHVSETGTVYVEGFVKKITAGNWSVLIER